MQLFNFLLSVLVLLPFTLTAQVITIPNPTPATRDYFGYAMASLGSDKLVVGAYSDNFLTADSGVVHVISTNGALIKTIANRNPHLGSAFGVRVAGMGDDLLLVSSVPDNRAYLFTTNDVLIRTFFEPDALSSEFGVALSAFGADRVLISATHALGLPNNAGATYLFHINGTLEKRLQSPEPAYERFGDAVLALPPDRVLVGAPDSVAYRGKAYLMHTNGSVLATFLNPAGYASAVSDQFGLALAKIGDDRFAIAAPGERITGHNPGVVHLFHTNGTRLASIPDPRSSIVDEFGCSLAVVGEDKLLIGARGSNLGAVNSGAAYLYSFAGTPLARFLNPTPAQGDFFGLAVAVVGGNRLFMSAYGEATFTGAVYGYDLTDHVQHLETELLDGNQLRLSWPASISGFYLDVADSFSAPAAGRGYSLLTRQTPRTFRSLFRQAATCFIA